MRLVSWNINGLRAYTRDGQDRLSELFSKLGADIVCFQETKMGDSSSISKDLACVPGFDSFWSLSQKKGYSGTATWARKGSTLMFEEGFGYKEHLSEGRCVMSDHGHFVLFNVYFVNGGRGDERLEYKMQFYSDFKQQVKQILQQGRQVIITGDVNTAHKEIDVWNAEKFKGFSGFLPIERQWIDELVEMGFVDTYRHLNPSKIEYTFWDTRLGKRELDQGWRIDYFFVSQQLLKSVSNAEIKCKELGSDHCPIVLDLKLEPIEFDSPFNAFNLMPRYQKPKHKNLLITDMFKRKSTFESDREEKKR